MELLRRRKINAPETVVGNYRALEGCVEIEGRVASRLGVGTGFHPEFTGRENVFLNSAILGMSKNEVCKNFDEMVAPARNRKVSRYSSEALLQRHVRKACIFREA